MVNNWWEERINLDAHLPAARGVRTPTADLDVDTHVYAHETSPKWRMDEPSVTITTYQDMTSPDLLDAKSQHVRRIATTERRRRLEGTIAMTAVHVPGSTLTPTHQSTLFHDPHKRRLKTVYRRDYCNPEFEMTMSRTPPSTAETPKRIMTQGSWIPGWGRKSSIVEGNPFKTDMKP
jgi:hypothetical protein